MYKRQKLIQLIQSFIQSETAYATALSDVLTLFVAPLRADAGTKREIVPREALPAIFGNLELLSQLSRDLVHTIKRSDGCWDAEQSRVRDPRAFWALLHAFIPQLQSYRQYLENYEVAQQALARHAACRKFQDFVAARALWRPDLALKAQLEAPTHHVRDISLFVARAEKLVSLDDPCYGVLSRCSVQLLELNNLLVEARIDAEHLLRLRELERRVHGTDGRLAQCGRRLLREGWLDKVNPKGKRQRRWFVLVSDQLLWAAPKAIGGGLALRGSLPLDAILVRPLAQQAHREHGLEVVRMDRPKQYPLLAESAELRDRWMADLNAIVEQYLQQGKEKARASIDDLSNSISSNSNSNSNSNSANSSNMNNNSPNASPLSSNSSSSLHSHSHGGSTPRGHQSSSPAAAMSAPADQLRKGGSFIGLGAGAGSPRPSSLDVPKKSASSKRLEYKSGFPALGRSSDRLSVLGMPQSRGKPKSPLGPAFGAAQQQQERQSLDLEDPSVPDELRRRLQALVAEARDWGQRNERLESSLIGIDRRLTVLEVHHRVVA